MPENNHTNLYLFPEMLRSRKTLCEVKKVFQPFYDVICSFVHIQCYANRNMSRNISKDEKNEQFEQKHIFMSNDDIF